MAERVRDSVEGRRPAHRYGTRDPDWGVWPCAGVGHYRVCTMGRTDAP